MRSIARAPAPNALSSEDGASQEYELLKVRSDMVDGEMLIAEASSGFPEVLQGLWWMDGNPLPDEVVSLGGSRWDPETRTTRIHVYGERIWSWDGNLLGRALYAMARRPRLVYELRFNEDLTCGVITPILRLFGRRVRVSERLVKLTMRWVRDGLWLRESWFFGLFYHVYHLRRIVEGDGERTDAYPEYVTSAPAMSYVAVRRCEARAARWPPLSS